MNHLDRLLQPTLGYLDLGMYAEANEELKNLPKDLQGHPLVLLTRLELLVEMGEWENGAELGASLTDLWPQEPEFWLKTAYCLHELKRTQEAKATLLAAPIGIRTIACFHYNLACYEAQLGNLEQSKEYLSICFEKEAHFREDALEDRDLEPVWDSVHGL